LIERFEKRVHSKFRNALKATGPAPTWRAPGRR
jgi:hypothetical protein